MADLVNLTAFVATESSFIRNLADAVVNKTTTTWYNPVHQFQRSSLQNSFVSSKNSLERQNLQAAADVIATSNRINNLRNTSRLMFYTKQKVFLDSRKFALENTQKSLLFNA